ncbi:STAS domain-containing protein [Nocardioides sp. TF02-7]|uniref:STAS domain-containing protein n=1 Tax=Nocardioides sp. TF02-7 TaxID=2917724 RepID=UPI001F059CEA|nr:STAS domain-containing protein [Nocardioides sp. TF02-7]UMG91676.1 STAS domain-containing protein [Nocardioides sp. TF02-7]
MSVHDEAPPQPTGPEDQQPYELSGGLDIRIRYSPSLPLVRLAGDLDSHTVHSLHDALGAVADADCPATMVLLDLGALTFCDVSGLQGIEDAATRLATAGKDLVLYATPPRVASLIEMTGVARRLLRR